MKWTYQSPAKVNLYLKVRGKRTDGFHDLETWMQTIDLADEVEFEKNNTDCVNLNCDLKSLPVDATNLVLKAVEIFKQTTGLEIGLNIELRKKIPIGSGLGGGSSNATTTLIALNEIYEAGLSDRVLIELAAKIGSDTAFFVKGGSWLCEGRGEILKKEIKTRKLYFLLITAPESADTAKIFANHKIDLTKNTPQPSFNSVDWMGDSSEEITSWAHNDLIDSFLQTFPYLKIVWKNIEREVNQTLCLSGSGSTMFLIYNNQELATEMGEKISLILPSNFRYTIACNLPDGKKKKPRIIVRN